MRLPRPPGARIGLTPPSSDLLEGVYYFKIFVPEIVKSKNFPKPPFVYLLIDEFGKVPDWCPSGGGLV